MIVPESALPWIQLHRTAVTNIRKDLGGSFIRLGDIGAAYTRMILIDYDEMIKGHWLPETCNAILDIGCGMAGIDVLLYRHYVEPRLFLLDGDGQVESQADKINFHPEGMKPFNDMAVMKELLSVNGVDEEKVSPLPIAYQGSLIHVDLCISLLSWGWHYSVGTYLDLVRHSLRPGGRLILDVRAGQGGERALADAGFELLGAIRSGPKGSRLCYRIKGESAQELDSSVFS